MQRVDEIAVQDRVFRSEAQGLAVVQNGLSRETAILEGVAEIAMRVRQGGGAGDRRAIGLDGFDEFSLERHRVSEIQVRVAEPRIEGQRCLAGGDGAAAVARDEQGVAEIVVGERVTRIELDRGPIRRDSARKITEVAEQRAEIVVRFGGRWLEPDCLAVGSQGLLPRAESTQGVGEVEGGRRELRHESERCTIRRDGLRAAALAIEHEPEGIEVPGTVRTGGDGASGEIFRDRIRSGLAGNHRELMQGTGLLRECREHLAAHGLGFCKASMAEVFVGDAQRLFEGDGGFAHWWERWWRSHSRAPVVARALVARQPWMR